MPKLAVPPPSSNPSRVIHTRSHHIRSILSRCASSHFRPLAHPQIRHDISPSPLSSNSLPPFPSRPPFNFKYSLTDDLNTKSQNDHKPPDERILKLGKTLRVLSPLLPTILVNPLPPHILSPSVTLHLFPSTHPHLPTVKGRTLYRAALWAVPVAWSSVPLVGNVKLQILSERIVRAGTVPDPHLNAHTYTQGGNGDSGDERLVVRWRTERTHSSNTPTSSSTSGSSASERSDTSAGSAIGSDGESRTGTNKGLSVLLGGDAPIFKLSRDDEFTGLFIFSFDEEGRILTQTIEHAEDASGWERTAKFVTLTDWLIGKARGSLDPAPPAGLLGCSKFGSNGVSTHSRDHERYPWHHDKGKSNRMPEASSL